MRTMRVAAVLAALLPMSAAAKTVPLPAEAAFQKVSMLLVEMGALPSFRDKELLVIKTDAVPVTLTPDQADCGKMFGIAYLKDRRTKTAATYQVVIKPIDSTSSDVTVTVTLTGYMDVNENAPFFIEKTRDTTKVLTCTSKGWLEAKLIEQLQQSGGELH